MKKIPTTIFTLALLLAASLFYNALFMRSMNVLEKENKSLGVENRMLAYEAKNPLNEKECDEYFCDYTEHDESIKKCSDALEECSKQMSFMSTDERNILLLIEAQTEEIKALKAKKPDTELILKLEECEIKKKDCYNLVF